MSENGCVKQIHAAAIGFSRPPFARPSDLAGSCPPRKHRNKQSASGFSPSRRREGESALRENMTIRTHPDLARKIGPVLV